MTNMHPKDRRLLEQCSSFLSAVLRIQDSDSERLPPSLAAKIDQITDLSCDVQERLEGFDIENN